MEVGKMPRLPLSDYQHCPIRNVISKFSDEWSMMVLWCIYQDESGIMDDKALSHLLPDCPQEMLRDTLDRLVNNHLLSREGYAQLSLSSIDDGVTTSTYYLLTDIGNSLMPNIMGLIKWAEENA